MPKSVRQRLSQLEQRAERIAPEKREEHVLYIDREQYEKAIAMSKAQYRPGPSQMQGEPRNFIARPSATNGQEPEEYPDAQRLKRLRDQSRAAEARDKLIW